MKKALLLILCGLLLFVIAFSVAETPAESKPTGTEESAAPSASPSATPSPAVEETESSGAEQIVLPSPSLSPSPAASPEADVSDDPGDGFDPYTIINEMTDEELAGQLFLARCPELTDAAYYAAEYHLGGYVLFANHTKDETCESLSAYIEKIQSSAAIPLLIGTDEEGGRVVRVSKYTEYRSTPFPSNRELFTEGGIGLIKETEKEKCELLKSLGFNLNLSPVCDITTDENAFMYSRSLGQSPDVTADFVREVIKIYREENVGSVLKHFPGYGNNTDTHTAIAVDERSLDELITGDLIPFFAGIKEGCGAILVSHTFINSIDDTLPASLSPKVLSFLRDEMNFSGVILTDDLVMQAISDLYGAGDSAVLALEAGADLLCSTEFVTQYEAVLSALESGRLSRERLEESAARILIWKHNIDLI